MTSMLPNPRANLQSSFIQLNGSILYTGWLPSSNIFFTWLLGHHPQFPILTAPSQSPLPSPENSFSDLQSHNFTFYLYALTPKFMFEAEVSPFNPDSRTQLPTGSPLDPPVDISNSTNTKMNTVVPLPKITSPNLPHPPSWTDQRTWSHPWLIYFSHITFSIDQKLFFFLLENIPRLWPLFTTSITTILSLTSYCKSPLTSSLLLSLFLWNLFSTQHMEWTFKKI